MLVPLFIDRLPLHSWVPQASRSRLPLWSVSLPIVLSDPGLPAPPLGARPQRWVIDTRFTGEAYAWRSHLLEAGVDPAMLHTGHTYLTPVGGIPQKFPLRDADVWLLSNIPALRNTPWRLELEEGIALRDVPSLPQPEMNCPLIGMRALEQSGLQIKLDFAKATVSVWTPGPWHQSLSVFLRRTLSGYATSPVPW